MPAFKAMAQQVVFSLPQFRQSMSNNHFRSTVILKQHFRQRICYFSGLVEVAVFRDCYMLAIKNFVGLPSRIFIGILIYLSEVKKKNG